jgi:hypothetical protein
MQSERYPVLVHEPSPKGFDTSYVPPQSQLGLLCACEAMVTTVPDFTGGIGVCVACDRRRETAAKLLAAIVRGALLEHLDPIAAEWATSGDAESDALDRREMRDAIDLLARVLS